MKKQFTCIVCPNGCEIEAEVENGQVISVTGHTCPRGEQYVRQELTAPAAPSPAQCWLRAASCLLPASA